MSACRIGFIVGLALFLLTVVLPAPAGMPKQAFIVAGLVALMAAWWMTEALPLTVTALMPFLVLPFAGVMDARETASAYYSPILFLILGGAFIALAIERTGLHRRLSLAILRAVGGDTAGGSGTGTGATRILLAFMVSAAVLSMLISNTSTTLIMMPMALAVLAGGETTGSAAMPGKTPVKNGLSGALPMGIAFAASIGGLGTLVGSPTNAIAVGLLAETIGMEISFAQWALYGLPIVVLGVPVAAVIVAKVQKVADHPFDLGRARHAIEVPDRWSSAERRLVPIVFLTFALWMAKPVLAPHLPAGSLTDGTIAIAASLALFILPDGTRPGGKSRPLLNWAEADRAPWGVIMMFGGGLALAAGMGASGLAAWLGNALLPLAAVPLWVVALALVAMVILITEFASNVATASAIIPVVASLVAVLGADPVLLAMPAALAASWGFMLPAGTGPNAIAWATGRIRIERMVGAGFVLDLIGVGLIVGVVWGIAFIAS
ncbi:SLC13 family permease [Alteripontixanthobacter maritimus]|uniref:SLC13 family permease n=1 Tax=Alteripontixanthobacter maritimus TaxID=2161824 RepID=UPI000E1BF784